MKEHPILFSTPMVQAILEGRKTQTRRITKPQLSAKCEFCGIDRKKGFGSPYALHTLSFNDGRYSCSYCGAFVPNNKKPLKCPYGQPGDLLWVRETFSAPGESQLGTAFLFKADFSIGVSEHKKNKGMWKPSIHMPKAAARIWLEITEVKVERLQDISEEDAIAEGCFKYGPFGEYAGSKHPSGGAMKYRAYSKAARAFQCIWESINGEQSWKKNPWVWVVKFKVLSTTGKPE